MTDTPTPPVESPAPGFNPDGTLIGTPNPSPERAPRKKKPKPTANLTLSPGGKNQLTTTAPPDDPAMPMLADTTGRVIHERSPHWAAYRRAWLADHPICAACGHALHVEVHHKLPVHLAPALELDPTNFITLCESESQCHLRVGHNGNWLDFNPNVERSAAIALARHTPANS